MPIILFGYPGAGKTYVGKILQKNFGYYFYDGDHDLTSSMKWSIQIKSSITDEQRDNFFNKLIHSTEQLDKTQKKLVIAQTFIKEKYRKLVLCKIPSAQFILVSAETAIREERLQRRSEYPLDLTYAREMCRNFDTPHINHSVIYNNVRSEVNLKLQIEYILNQVKSFD